MTRFICRKLLTLIMATITTLLVIGGSAHAVSYGAAEIGSEFLFSFIFISATPSLFFLLAYFYQSYVVMPMLQLSAIQSTNLPAWQKSVVNTANAYVVTTRSVPAILTVFGALMAVALTGGIMGNYALNSSDAIHQALISVSIAANVLLMAEMLCRLDTTTGYINKYN